MKRPADLKSTLVSHVASEYTFSQINVQEIIFQSSFVLFQ